MQKSGFKETYAQLESEMKRIVHTVRSVPPHERPGTAHIDHMSAILQYTYYVSLVRNWLSKPDAKVLDWGGQHGQVTRLLSHFYANTTCYVLADDSYDRRYGLADWHRRLGIEQVVWSSDPRRITMPDCSFDAAISSGVLEHVGECGVEDREALSELHRVLRPNGFLFIWNLPRRFGREYFYPLIHRTAHQRRYRKNEIIELLRETGFSIQHFSCQELLPLSVLKRLEHVVSPYTIVRYDYAAAELFGFLAQNFTLVAKRV